MSKDTKNTILDAAERMIQERGFHDVSFRAIASAVGIKSASVHYHFPSKSDLGVALANRYREQMLDFLGPMDGGGKLSGLERLERFSGAFVPVLERGHMCLCGVLGAETGGLPEPVEEAAADFFKACIIWLTGAFEDGLADQSLQFSGSPENQAVTYISLLEGAMLLSLSLKDHSHLARVRDSYLALLTQK